MQIVRRLWSPEPPDYMKGEIYISVDIETSGPLPGVHSMLSFGACIVGNSSEQLYVEFQPISDEAIPEAMEISGLSIDELKKTGLPPAKGMKQINDWVVEVAANGKPIFVAFNACFDWTFVNWYFLTYCGVNPFGIGGVDIKAYYMGIAGCSWSDTSSSSLPKHLSLDHEKEHNALADAVAQGKLFQKLLEMSDQNGAR